MPHPIIMRKVLHVGPCNTPGGMATVMHTLAEFPPDGWQADLLASHAPGSVWAKWRAYRSARRALKQRCRSEAHRPDVVHVHTAADWSWRRKVRLISLARAFDVPVVIHIHSGKFDRWLASLPQRQCASLRGVFEQPATLGVVLSDGWRDRLQPTLGVLDVVPNPVSPRFQPGTQPREKQHLLLLGRADPVKGHEFCILLARALRTHAPALRLTLTGMTETSEDWIEARGWVTEEEKLRLLQSASVLLVPSGFEGQPMVMLEAISCGLPVCVSDRLVDVPEGVSIAKYGDVEDWSAQVNSLLAAPPSSASLQIASEAFSPESVKARWESLYESLIAR